MSVQTETTQPTVLLDRRGRLHCPSWASDDLFVYNKERAWFPWRRREWEFYQLSDRHFALQVYCGHTGLYGIARATLIDLGSGRSRSETIRRFFPGDSMDLDTTSGRPHRFRFEDERRAFTVDFDGEYRKVIFRGETFDVQLMFPDAADAVCTAVPFDSRRHFHYGMRKCFLDVRGKIRVRGTDYPIGAESFVILNSGRGVWPVKKSFIWGSGTTMIGGDILSVNIGWGLGRAAAGSENALFLNGTIHKLDRVRERRDAEDFMQPSRIESNDHRLEAVFTPACDSLTRHRLLFTELCAHQVFGTLRGTAVLDDGTEIDFEDMTFFILHYQSRW